MRINFNTSASEKKENSRELHKFFLPLKYTNFQVVYFQKKGTK